MYARMTMSRHFSWIIIVLLPSLSTYAWPDVEVESREYKAMIQANLFAWDSSNNEAADNSRINNNTPLGCPLEPPFLRTLANEMNALALSVGAESNGFFRLKPDMPRFVEFYDTPGDCRLYSNNWIVRLRKHVDKTNGEPWEGTLKSRSGDRYHSTYRRKDMNECCEDCRDLGGKFEEDLNLLWHSRFSYSHSCEIHESRGEERMHQLSDISFHWVEMESVFVEVMDWDLSTQIAKVGDVTIRECVYNGLEVNFDEGKEQHMGQFFVTLWYAQEEEESSSSPSVAELSFKLRSTGKKLEDWSKGTIMTAHAFWNKVKDLSIVEPNGLGKTEWAYRHNASWCE